MADDEGASKQEQLIEACRRNNVDLLNEIVEECGTEDEISKLMNETKTVMGNHLYHEAASRGNYEIIDALLDQPNFECDPLNRSERDTPLHSAIRWINSEGERNWGYGNHLVDMMLEAGSSTRVKNRAKLTPLQLVDPRNKSLRDLIMKHEYANLNQGDFVDAEEVGKGNNAGLFDAPGNDDDDAEFSGSDEGERAEWERQRKAIPRGIGVLIFQKHDTNCIETIQAHDFSSLDIVTVCWYMTCDEKS
ncbi:hypothetical protein MKZ38_006953 [Zalerion maritima]|uniref:Ankyrin repeat protein n=1 Tax=Zalerion maritima TaxID=339359 RepID=A0AAD5WWP6_9PEZI|nr:hypothetical protein MKZ38_006953 [Zalerion maritima]